MDMLVPAAVADYLGRPVRRLDVGPQDRWADRSELWSIGGRTWWVLQQDLAEVGLVRPEPREHELLDREVERVLRGMIEEAFPEHGILGEEHGAVRLDRPWVWVLDPIDGTKSFVTGKPLFGTLIALLEFPVMEGGPAPLDVVRITAARNGLHRDAAILRFVRVRDGVLHGTQVRIADPAVGSFTVEAVDPESVSWRRRGISPLRPDPRRPRSAGP